MFSGNASLLALGLVLLGFAPPALSAAESIPLQLAAARSRVAFAVKSTVDSFEGKLDSFQSEIRIDSATSEIVSAEVGFRWSDVKTGKADRDKEMNAWQASGTYPSGRFVLKSLAKDAAGAVTANGTLEFHGQTHELAFPISISRSGGYWVAAGEAVVDTRVFGLPVIRKFGLLKVDPLVKVIFHLEAAAPGGASS